MNMPTKLAPHGSEAGYRQEVGTGSVCERCRQAHREFNRQYTKNYKAKGIKYDRYQVIAGMVRETVRTSRVRTPASPPQVPVDKPQSNADGWGDLGPVSVGTRLTEAIRSRLGGSDAIIQPEYVDSEEIPDYLHPIDPDPEPDGDWSQIHQDSTDYVINAAGMAMIEDNLGTYLSVIGITIDMIDPYCGPILATNLERMVKKWAKVISHYPKAAELFMNARGGVIMDWIGALQVTWPFLYAIYEHHLARTVRVHDGIIERKIANEFRPPFDATMPPMPNNFEFTTGG